MNREGTALEFPCVHFPDSFGWDAESCQEVVFQFVTVGLDRKGPLHAEQPGIAFLVSDGELFVKTWDTNRPIVLLK